MKTHSINRKPVDRLLLQNQIIKQVSKPKEGGLNKNKLILNGPVKTFNSRNLDAFGNFFAVDCINHTMPPDMQGLAGVKKFIRQLLDAFPDMKVEVQKETEIAEGDMVSHRLTATGTHRGIFLGISPTGKKISWTMQRIAKIKNGKIVEFWVDSDRFSLQQQLKGSS